MLSPSCDKCERPAILFQRFSGRHLCQDHFIRDLESRAKRTIRMHGWVRPGDRIGVALSGGKDSTALLYFLHDLISPRKDIGLVAITVDEGIGNYRDSGRVVRIAESLGCPCITASFQEAFGITMDGIVAETGDSLSCSHCGIRRRQLLNTVAIEHGVNRLALGFNLDDEAQSVLMNVLRGDAAHLLMSRTRQDGMVERIKPFMFIPEREVALYAHLRGVPFDAGRCPYGHNALRADVRGLLNRYAWNHPATKFALVNLGKECAAFGAGRVKRVERKGSDPNIRLNSGQPDEGDCP